MDNFKVIYRILHYLEKAMDYNEADVSCISASALGISESRWTAIMEMIVREGYVIGVTVSHSCSGEILTWFNDPRITLHGLEYLNENSLMQKAAKQAKEIAEMTP